MFCACHHCHAPTAINQKEYLKKVNTVHIVFVRDLIPILPNLLYKTYTRGYENYFVPKPKQIFFYL